MYDDDDDGSRKLVLHYSPLRLNYIKARHAQTLKHLSGLLYVFSPAGEPSLPTGVLVQLRSWLEDSEERPKGLPPPPM